MKNIKKSVLILVVYMVVLIGFVIWKNLTGDINIESSQLRHYATLLSLVTFVSGIFAGIAVKNGEGGLSSTLLGINICIFIVTFWIGIVSTLLQIPLFG